MVIIPAVGFFVKVGVKKLVEVYKNNENFSHTDSQEETKQKLLHVSCLLYAFAAIRHQAPDFYCPMPQIMQDISFIKRFHIPFVQ